MPDSPGSITSASDCIRQHWVRRQGPVSVMGYGFVMGIRFDMTVGGAGKAKVQRGNWRTRERASTWQSEKPGVSGPIGVMASGGLSAEPLEVGWGLPLVRGASRQDIELDAEVRRVRTSWLHWPLWVCRSPRLITMTFRE